MNNIGVLGDDKGRNTLSGHELGNSLFKKEVWINILSGKDNVIMEYGCPVDKICKVFSRDEAHIIDMFLRVLHLTTDMRGYFVEKSFEHSIDITLRD